MSSFGFHDKLSTTLYGTHGKTYIQRRLDDVDVWTDKRIQKEIKNMY